MKIRLYCSLILMMNLPALANENPFNKELFIAPEHYQNDPPVSGKMAADTCSACHGTQGRIFNEIIPPLAGLPKMRFVTMMMRFKRGQRPAFIMNSIARTFTREEIDLRIINNEVNITVVEPNSLYTFCPGSNEVPGRRVQIDDIHIRSRAPGR